MATVRSLLNKTPRRALDKYPRKFHEGLSVTDELFIATARAVAGYADHDVYNVWKRAGLMSDGFRMLAPEEHELSEKACAEVMAWFIYRGDRGRKNYVGASENVNVWKKRFERLNNNEELLPWYRAGIFDKEYINKCRAEGVDPQLAAAMDH